MPMVNSSVYGLIILSFGILGVIVSFLIGDKKKYFVALVLASLVMALGAYEYVGASVRQWRTSRRISKLQGQQRLNLEVLQERLRQAQNQVPKSK